MLYLYFLQAAGFHCYLATGVSKLTSKNSQKRHNPLEENINIKQTTINNVPYMMDLPKLNIFLLWA